MSTSMFYWNWTRPPGTMVAETASIAVGDGQLAERASIVIGGGQ